MHPVTLWEGMSWARCESEFHPKASHLQVPVTEVYLKSVSQMCKSKMHLKVVFQNPHVEIYFHQHFMKSENLENILFLSFIMKMKLIKMHLKKSHLMKVKIGDVVVVGSWSCWLKNLIRMFTDYVINKSCYIYCGKMLLL